MPESPSCWEIIMLHIHNGNSAAHSPVSEGRALMSAIMFVVFRRTSEEKKKKEVFTKQ